ncbi:MAG TPA: hypothetical protein VKR61_19575 [Bryobacteraceae bacterium]|nr:hypothetical protein [Bryobacteraceae bacterium]
MNLADLRKVTVKKRLRIHFTLSNGMECMLNEHGIAKVAALRAPPSFNLEDELAGVREFRVEPVVGEKEKERLKSRKYSRDEMTALATDAPGATAHDDHEE